MLPILDSVPAVAGDIEGQRQITRKSADGTGGGPFGDILNAQGKPPAAESETEARQEPVLQGGNVVQSGGKDLPEQPVPGAETAVLATTSPMAAPAAPLPFEGLPPVEKLVIDQTAPSPGSLPIDQTGSSPGNLSIDQTGSSPGNLSMDQTGPSPGNLAMDQTGSSPGSLSMDQTGPSPGNLAMDQARPPPGNLSIDQAGSWPGNLPVDRAEPSAPATVQRVSTASHRAAVAEERQSYIVPVGQLPSAMAGQPPNAMTGQMASAMTSQFARASSTDKSAPAPGAAITGAAPGQSDALSKLISAGDGLEGMTRETVPSHGKTPMVGGVDAARLTRAVEPALRADFTATEGAPIVAREGAALETPDLLKGLELTQVKQPATVPAQPQPVTASIQMPPGVTELPAGLKMTVSSAITTPVNDPSWNGELIGRVSIMVKNSLPEANLQLTPPELGRLDIRITTEGDQARVQFAVQSMDARDAIEQAMPRLREMLEQSGLQLARSEVADYSQSRQGESHVSGNPSDQATADLEENPDDSIREFAVAATSSTVDYYV